MTAVADAADGFSPIQWDAPLDPAAYLEGVPADVTVKGMFISRLLVDAEKAGAPVPEGGPYRSFKDYPLRVLMELELTLASSMFGELPVREALRRLGWTGFPTLRDSMIGRVIFAPAGRDMAAVMRMASRGYRVSLSVSDVSVEELPEPRTVIVHLRKLYNFADTFQVGVFEGAIRYYDLTPTILVRRHSPSDVDLLVRWA